jgi:hypothetical protein
MGLDPRMTLAMVAPYHDVVGAAAMLVRPVNVFGAP